MKSKRERAATSYPSFSSLLLLFFCFRSCDDGVEGKWRIVSEYFSRLFREPIFVIYGLTLLSS